jgi:uncharacterized protein (TIGR04255 family)
VQWPDIPPLVRTGRHYSRAPIAEAIIEIRCEPAPDVSLDDLLQSVDKNAFPTADPTVAVQERFNISERGLHGETRSQQIGYVFRRADGKRVVQARLDAFSLSCLPPYERWELFVAEAEAHWLRYRQAARPTKSTRLGVRFINKIDIPATPIEIKDYLRVAVDVPAYLPQGLSGYFLQIEVPLSQFDSVAAITSTLVPSPDENSTSLVLDIDASQAVQIDLMDETEAEGIAAHLEQLREAKNYIFESCITDATRGLIL